MGLVEQANLRNTAKCAFPLEARFFSCRVHAKRKEINTKAPPLRNKQKNNQINNAALFFSESTGIHLTGGIKNETRDKSKRATEKKNEVQRRELISVFEYRCSYT